MTFERAFFLYSSYLQDKLNTHASRHEWISKELSSEQPDGSWKLVGSSTDTVVAQIWKDGSCDFNPLKE